MITMTRVYILSFMVPSANSTGPTPKKVNKRKSTMNTV